MKLNKKGPDRLNVISLATANHHRPRSPIPCPETEDNVLFGPINP